MSEVREVLTEYVPKYLFELHIQSLRDKSASDEKLNDARIQAVERLLDERFDTFLALMEKNLAEHKAVASRTDGKVEVISAKLEHAVDSLTIAINSNEKRFEDFKAEIQAKQSSSFARWGIWTALFVGAVQVVVSVVLHFWH